jgi:hypothetical protein
MWMRVFLLFAVCAGNLLAAEKLKRDENFFPLAVWVQSPNNAERFKAAGVNTYVGLWRGPTEEHLAKLKAAGMKIVCAQNQTALAHKDDTNIIAWLQGDEPDNAQSLGEGKGWGPPISPEKVVERYEKMRAADPTRPIVLNLGQGVAWDNWIGRGVRRNHPEDYVEYVNGGDIVSFDIYPATHEHADIKGNLEYVGKGVERLKKWAGPEREVWNCVEAKIAKDSRVTPHQLRAEVWMSIIHGSRGIIYFVHQFEPVFREASVFEDAELLKAFTAINKQIAGLAPVLNSQETLPVEIVAKAESGPVAALAKKHGPDIYVFAVAMANQKASATLKVQNAGGDYEVEVLEEGRRFQNVSEITATFEPYEVHLYKMTPARKP